MPYFNRTALIAYVPAAFQLQALDDNQDGVEDPGIYDELVSAAQTEIDGILGKRFDVPFVNPIPNIVSDAALKLVAELMYTRRGFDGEKNPLAKRASDVRKALATIASGTDPLTPGIARKAPSASVVVEAAKTSSATGRIAI